MISSYFIDRPIFASVISAFIVIAGLAALRVLPIAQYPDILPPQVEVQAFYPGANAETVAQTVAAPLDQAINGVDGMLYLRSASAGNGALVMAVTFAIGSDPDLNAINVNNRVQSALSALPEEVRRQGVTVRKSQQSFLKIIALDSADPRFDALFISNYALLNVVDELRRIPGVGDVQIFGSKDWSIRIWLRPDVLAKLGLTPGEVAEAVREQNAQFAAGRIGQEPMDRNVDFTFSVTTQGRLTDPEQFGDIVVRTSEQGGIVRLRDVARIELGSREYDFSAERNGKPTVPIGIFLQPGANALEVGDAVDARMAEIGKRFPAGLDYSAPYDTTTYIKVSIREVLMTLAEAMALVFLVVFVFLQNWRATVIPMLAVPVSLIGTLAAMLAFGFSINTLTLFGMVLAIGIVVDDAIVVLENVERIIATEGLEPREATHKAMQQVTRPVIAIVFVLTAVFLPVAFLGGLVGEMYRQFAVTIAVSVAISGFVALTLTPALCATVLRHEDAVRHGALERFNLWFGRMTGRYASGVRYLLRHTTLALALIAVMLVATFALFRAVPNALAPKEDQGYLMVMPILPDAASLQRTEAVSRQISQALLANPHVDQVMTFSGLDVMTFTLRTNTGITWVNLKDWSERKGEDASAGAIAGYMFGAGMQIKDAFVLAFEPPPIEGLSMTGGFDGFVQSRAGGTMKELEAATQALVAAASQRKELANVNTTFSASVPQVRMELDREKAKLLGVKVSDVFETLQSTFGALYVNDFNRAGRVFRVHLQSEAEFRARPNDIRNVYVRAGDGSMVPLTALVTVSETTGPEVIERYNVFPSAKVIGDAAPGYSSGEALAAMEEVARTTLPDGYALEWTGTSYQEKVSGGSARLTFLVGVLMVLLVLAAQYEKWTLPFAVILAVPFAVFGALLAVFLRGQENDLYFQIGLVTLVGLASKNAILIVEFAQLKVQEGMSLVDAAVEGARLRFRPIVMTSLAFILGVLPLAISGGAGAASRHSIGTGVIGGMLAATFIATFFVPLFFRWIASRGVDKFHVPRQAAAQEGSDAA
ncbi:MAG TPA: multidrug efflux RND transporter permease subunit [Steroidobacteraceae bacterium]|nr:multidrug efflux RND transporter permease subunit [Steroidobacteraceae bacterium]